MSALRCLQVPAGVAEPAQLYGFEYWPGVPMNMTKALSHWLLDDLAVQVPVFAPQQKNVGSTDDWVH